MLENGILKNPGEDVSGGAPSVVARVPDFPAVGPSANGAPLGNMSSLLDVTVTVTAEFGRVKLPISSLLKLAVGSVLEMDRGITEPVDLLVQGTLLARGEIVVVGDRFAIRLKELIDPKLSGRK
jgi:flagellar motor switch protein FliN/FliY